MARRSMILAIPVAVVGATLGLAQDKPDTAPRPPETTSYASLKADAILPVTLDAGSAATKDAVWLIQKVLATAVRLDPKDNSTAAPVSTGKTPCATVAEAFDSLWVPLCDGAGVARVDVKGGAVSATLALGVADAAGSIAVAVGSLWILTDPKGVLSRIDPATDAAVAEVYLAARPSSVAAEDDALWITSEEGAFLTRVDPHTMSPELARGKAVDKRTDIWAFGCVLFEMLTATRLFAGESVAETLGLNFIDELRRKVPLGEVA